MASINGLSVKGLKSFLGHENEVLYQGNLYLNGKKIGFWSQDSWGGPDMVDLDNKYDKKLLQDAIKSRNEDKSIHGSTDRGPYVVDYDLDLLMYDYIKLADSEKSFKNALKKGYAGILAATDGFHKTTWNLPKSYTEMSDTDLLAALDVEIKKVKSAFWKESVSVKHEINIYRSLDDFNIGEPISVNDISRARNLDQVISDADKSVSNLVNKETNMKGHECER